MVCLHRLANAAAQDSLEYLLVIGLVGVPLVAGFIFGLSIIIPEAVDFICPSIDPGGSGSCF